MDISGFISQILTSFVQPMFQIIYWIFSLIPKVPDFPVEIYQNFRAFLDFLFSSNGLGFVGWFFGGWTIPLTVISIGIIISLTRIVYLVILFFLTKIPVFGWKR